ncbi:MAG TPA: hypothetical protein VFX03_13715, partial [Thermomicrobiales bacterium]|nr:hypothetical protein [Thermomicrobiales bacterium]
PDKTSAGKATVHNLIKVSDLPLTYGSGVNMDGKTFYVVNPGNDPDHFGLSLTPGGAALTLTAQSGATNDHRIGPESIDLSAASGDQILRIDLTASLNGATLLGPGGVPLNVISPPIGDGASSATARGSGGGLISVKVNDATINYNPTVQSYVSAGLMTAGNDVTISSDSTSNATASATNASGGLVGFSDSSSTSNETSDTEAYVDTDTRIVAGGDFDLRSNSDNQASISTRSITGGFVGAAVANATTNLIYTTTATVKTGADVLAGGTLRVSTDGRSSQSANATASGLGFGGDGTAHAHGNIGTGKSDVEVASAAALSARSVLLAATTSEIFFRTQADGRGAGFIAIGHADATIGITTENKVLVDDNAAVSGYEGVDFR